MTEPTKTKKISSTETAKDTKLKEQLGADLATLLANATSSHLDVFQDFTTLTERLKSKQTELDIMASDSLPSSIISAYLSDVLLPNANGDLISIIPSNMNYQSVLDNIYKRLNIPEEKVVFSLIKNGIAIAEFAQVSNISLAKQVSANESARSQVAPADESVFIRKPGSILPSISIINDTYTVFPIVRYERCIGFIEVKKDPVFFDSFDWKSDNLTYTDVVLHPIGDYVYETFGVPHTSKPLQLSIIQEDKSILTYDIATGCSLLENSYTAWKTLSILQDSIVLASLIKNAQIMLIETESGAASKEHIAEAKIKLRSLFEGQLAMGQNGMKSYLSPQSKPAYIYSFTSSGVGKISAQLIGGEYNPGQLYYLTPFVNQFFAGMGYPKQFAGFADGAAGMDGGGSALEQYTLRYKSNVSKFKRLYARFVKKCINNVLMSKGLTNLVDAFDVKVYGAYEDAGQQEVQLKQSQMALFESVLSFTGIDNPAKQRQLRSVMIKQVITDKEVLKAIDEAMTAIDTPEAEAEQQSTDIGSQIPEGVEDSLLGLEETSTPLEESYLESSQSVELPEMPDTLSDTTEE